MRKLKISLIFFIICLLQFSCSESITTEAEQKINIFTEGTEFQGSGMGWNQDESLWSLSILENDSILLIEKDIRDSAGIHNINIQYFGSIVENNDYSYQLNISEALFGSGCDKPSNEFLDTDTIPIYLDTNLFINSPVWELHTIDTSVNIRESPYLLHVRHLNDKVLTFIPSLNSEYQALELLSGYRCGVHIGIFSPDEKYYLEDNNGSYQLIIINEESQELYGDKCNNCVKVIELSRL